MDSFTLDADAAAWVAATDQAAIARHSADQQEYLAHAPSYIRDIFDPEDDALDPDESWPTPYGPAVPAGVPVMLTDVDGMLSPFANPFTTGLVDPADPDKWPVWEPHRFSVETSTLMDMPMSPSMGAALAALPLQKVFLTTWNEHANAHIAPRLGWDPLPVLSVAGGRTFSSERGGWAKLHVVKCWLRTFGPRPLVWADDDYRLEDLAADDVYISSLPHVLLVRTDRDTGMTPAQVAQIQAFLDGLPTA